MATLEGKWELLQASGNKFPPGVVFTFQDGRYHYPYGNQHSGSYQTNGNKVEWGPGISTMMWCDMQPPEHVLSEALNKTSQWSIQGNLLHLKDGTGAMILELKRV